MEESPDHRPTSVPTGPLSGLHVIELTLWVQGPLAATMLADLGADVVKVERAGGGDPLRNMATPTGKEGDDGSHANIAWTTCNRNKRSITLDLYKPEAQAVFHRLLRGADIFVTNLQPAALERFSADEATVRGVNPQIIYARGGGFGDHGPRAKEPCQDTVGMAYSGFMFACASSPDRPHYPPGALSDVMTGTVLAAGVLAAVVERKQTGRGSVVSTSQLQSMMWLQSLGIAGAANLGEAVAANSNERPANPLLKAYPAGDGAWIALAFPLESQWPVFLEAVSLTYLVDDVRFLDAQRRAENSAQLMRLIEEHLASAPAGEWLERMRAKGLWVGPVNRVQDLIDDVQVEANGYLMELDDGFRTPTMPFSIEGHRPATRSTPAYGADTDAVLLPAGLSAADITALRIEGAVW